MQSPLPQRSVSLSIVDNKVQIITIICDSLVECFQEQICQKHLVITGSDPVPNEVQNGIHVRRQDLTTTHEEADVTIINQVMHVARLDTCIVHVVYHDMDVFILLMHFYATLGLKSDIFMVPTSMT